MKKLFKILFALLIVFVIAGCSSNKGVVESGSVTSYSYKSTSGDNDVVDTETSLKITYTVDYSIYKNSDETKKLIKDKVDEYSGGILESYESESYSRIEYKVPTDKLNEFLDYVDSFDGVGSKSVSSEDITSSYNYTEAQIEILTASIARLNTLLESATTTADVIAIQKQLDEYNSTLLALQNTKAAYDDELNYSRVTIKYYPESEEEEVGFFEEYLGNLLSFFTWFGTALLYIIPIGGVLGGATYGIILLIKKIVKKRNKEK